MANRKFGNYSSFNSRNSSNRNFNQGQPSNISPWQVGPNPSGTDSTQSLQNQLALALTNIIQSAQSSNVNDGPPSLFSLNTSPGFLKPNRFNNQNNFSNKRDFKRPEPYFHNKNRLSGWRSDAVNQNNKGQNSSSSKRGSFSRENRSQHSNSRENFKKPNDLAPPKQEKQTSDNENNGNKNEPDSKPAAASNSNKEQDIDKVCKYKDLPKGLLHCFLCNKSMWDGASFQNHVGGKAHNQMFNSLEETFKITVNILRENMRLTEERKMIELERVHRSRKHSKTGMHNEPESYCNMCDLKFFGRIVPHRQSESHQRLKRFLHPKCRSCNLEFTSRMEWVEHLFHPEHLQKVQAYLDSKKLDYKAYKTMAVLDIETEPLLQEQVQNENEHPVLELDEDLTNLFNRIPVYKSNREVAKNSVQPATGFICQLCNLFMPTEEDSKAHKKTERHYLKFVDSVKTKYQLSGADTVKKDESQVGEQSLEGEDLEAKIEETSDIQEEQEHNDDEEETKDYDCTNEEEMNKLLDDIYMNSDISTVEEAEQDDGGEQGVAEPPKRVTRRSANVNNSNPVKKARLS